MIKCVDEKGRSMKKQLCGLFLTGVFIAFGAYALAGPTQQQGVAGLSRVAAAMSDICHECCVTEDSCTIDQCQAEAAAIQPALIITWNADFGKGSNPSRDEVGGYLLLGLGEVLSGRGSGNQSEVLDCLWWDGGDDGVTCCSLLGRFRCLPWKSELPRFSR